MTTISLGPSGTGELQALMPARQVVIARELTKRFEEYLRGRPAELLGITRGRSWKGELVVLVGPGEEGADAPELPEADSRGIDA